MNTALGSTLETVTAAWNRFFFDPISPATIGIFRIAFGLVVFTAILGVFPFRTIFYGDLAIVPPEVMNAYLPTQEFLRFRWYVPYRDPGLQIYFIILLLSSVCLTLGLFTRVASILVFFGILGLHNTNSFNTNRGDELMRINALLLIFSEAGAAYSVDRWVRRRRGIEGPELPRRSPWAQRVIQLQLAFLYINTAWLKLEGPSWRDGTALYYALNYLELQRFSFKYVFYTLWQIKLATWGTLLAEAAAGTLIWWKPLRYPVLLAAIGLHAGINLAMQFPTFQYVMIASLLTFLIPEDVERWVGRGRELLSRAQSSRALRSKGL